MPAARCVRPCQHVEASINLSTTSLLCNPRSPSRLMVAPPPGPASAVPPLPGPYPSDGGRARRDPAHELDPATIFLDKHIFLILKLN
jgi:hypothetical protein